jgi:hypothetical protein
MQQFVNELDAARRSNRNVAGLIMTKSIKTPTSSTIVNPEDDKFTAENSRVPPTPNTNVIGSKPNGWLTPISVSHQSEQMRVDRLSEVLQQFINELERGLTAPTDMSTSHESTTPKASKAVGVSNACRCPSTWQKAIAIK